MILIGMGRVGGALAALDPSASVVTRTRGWAAVEDETNADPIVACVRNDDLDGVVARIPPSRRDALVLVQNGMLRPWAAEQGLARITRGLLFFAVPARGATLTPGGSSPFSGPRAGALVEWLQRLGIPAHLASDADFAEIELEKLVWNCVFGLLCEVHDCAVGPLVGAHAASTRGLVDELAAVGASALGIRVDLDALWERLRAYTLQIPDYRGAVKEWVWRNGWFVEVAREQQRATPLHDRALRESGHLQLATS